MTPIPPPTPDTQEFLNLIQSSTEAKPENAEEFKDWIAKTSEQSVISDSKNLSLKEMDSAAKTRTRERTDAVRKMLQDYCDLLSPRAKKGKEKAE